MTAMIPTITAKVIPHFTNFKTTENTSKIPRIIMSVMIPEIIQKLREIGVAPFGFARPERFSKTLQVSGR